jgi:putative flippase GtrA
MKLFVECFDIWPTPSKMLTTVISVLYSFLMARYFTFTDVGEENIAEDREE